jgi:hypothetical protein
MQTCQVKEFQSFEKVAIFTYIFILGLLGSLGYVLAALDGDKLGDMVHLILSLWRKNLFPSMEHAILIYQLFRGAVLFTVTNLASKDLSQWINTLSTVCKSIFEGDEESSRFLTVFACSGIIKGRTNSPLDFPTESFCAILHQALSLETTSIALEKTGFVLALAQSGAIGQASVIQEQSSPVPQILELIIDTIVSGMHVPVA